MSSYTIISFSSREMPKEYRTLIVSKWLRKIRYGNDFYKMSHSASYYKAYAPYIERILDSDAACVRLAVLSDDHDIVVGMLIHRSKVLDFVWVDTRLREQGIAKSLLPEGIDTFSHITKDALKIIGKNYKCYGQWKFNPFA